METGLWVAACLMAGGTGFVGLGLYVILRCKKLKQTGLVREAVVNHPGRVFARAEYGGPAPAIATGPVLEYFTAQGKYQLKSRLFSSGLFFPFKDGDTVRIFYDTANFQRFYVEGDRVPALLAALFIGLGLVMLQGAVILHFSG